MKKYKFLLVIAIMFLFKFFAISSMDDIKSYREMFLGAHPPIWKKLTFKQISKGDNVNRIIKKYPPRRLKRKGKSTILTYWLAEDIGIVSSYVGITIIAKNGKTDTAIAWSCTSKHIFFGKLKE